LGKKTYGKLVPIETNRNSKNRGDENTKASFGEKQPNEDLGEKDNKREGGGMPTSTPTWLVPKAGGKTPGFKGTTGLLKTFPWPGVTQAERGANRTSEPPNLSVGEVRGGQRAKGSSKNQKVGSWGG